METPVRLQRYLAAAGVAARRKAEDLITAGRVTVNGKVVTTLGTKVDPSHDQVMVDGEAVVPLDYFYVLFNKPKGCITAVTDDRGRATVMDYLPNLPVPVKPVGRLDYYTEGVLLLTNDGELAARLLAPSSHVPKTYHVKVHGQLRPDQIKRLRDGVQLDDGTTTLPAEIEVLPGESKHTWLAITIHEGKHRQIHRMIEAVGHPVDKLQRVAFANLTFHHLRVGDGRELTQQELNELRDLVGLDHSAVARGKWTSKREQTDIPRRARAKAIAEAEEAAALAADRRAGADDREDAWDWAGEGEPMEPSRSEAREPEENRGARGGRGGDRVTRFDRRDRGGGPGGKQPRESAARGSRAPQGGRTGRDARPQGGRTGRDARPQGRGDRDARPQGGRGGYDARPQGRGDRDARPQGGRTGRDARPQGGRGGYDSRPQGRGDRDARPQSGRGGYDARPQGGRTGRDARPQGGRGGYDSRPQGRGDRDARPQSGRGGYDARPQGGRTGRDARPQGRGDRDARPQGGRDARPQRGPGAGSTRAGQGRSFGKRTGASGGRRGPRR